MQSSVDLAGQKCPRGPRRYSVGTYIFCYFVIGIVMVISLFPFLWLMVSSFKTNPEVFESAFSIPKTPSFEGYRYAIRTTHMHLRFGTSLFVSGLSTLASIVIYAMAGYVLARYQFKLRGALFAVLISSMLIPMDAMIQPIYTLISALGLYDTKWALILVYTAFGMPMCLFLLRSYFANIPLEIEESAYLEGAGFFTTFRKIMLPLAQPAIISATVMTFLGNWNELLFALLLTSSEHNRTLPLMMKYFTSGFSFNYPPMFAALVMYIAPTVVLYIVLQEQIMTSLVAGAVKG